MGDRNQRHPSQDCGQLQIQPYPRRGFHPQGLQNPRHRRRVTIFQENECARGIGRHGQSGDDKVAAIGSATTGATVPLRKFRGEHQHRHSNRQQGTGTQERASQIKIKRAKAQSLLPPSFHVSIAVTNSLKKKGNIAQVARPHENRTERQ